MKKLFSIFLMALVGCVPTFSQTLSEKELADLNQQVKQYDYVGPFSEGLAIMRKNNKVGFIDKTGKLAIPMDFNASDNCISPSNDLENVFNYGLLASRELGVIDKQGNVLVPKDSIKDIFFANDGDVLVVTTNTNCYVYEKGVFVSNKYPVLNFTTNEVLTINGKIVNDEDLIARGYSRFDTQFSKGKPYCGAWRNYPFIVKKNGKYGIIDRFGNELHPCISETYHFNYHLGLTFEANTFTLLNDGYEKNYPLWCDVYKNGTKVLEKISSNRTFKGLNFIKTDGTTQDQYDYWKNSFEIELPPTVKETFMFDKNGKRIEKAPFGKNFLTLNSEGELILVKKDGSPVFKDKFTVLKPVGPYYVLEFYNDVRPRLLNENGDTVMVANLKIARYVDDGTISFNDLRKYSNIETVDFPYIKNQSKQDKLATLEFHAGRMPVKPQTYDRSYFSEGLINVKIDGVWCYMNNQGKGLPKKH
ncbi:MAG: WG repeat-containing protein [Paludibacteraceae bacterium]|nr:WG repeat-containing protein [Paludibacteraceae bacterium]